MLAKLGAGMALAMVLLTSACGGSDDSSDAGGSKSASPSPSASASDSSTPSPSSSPTAASTGRPKEPDLAKALQTGSAQSGGQGYTKAQADCVAGILLKSDVSDSALAAISTLDPNFKATAADNTALGKVATKLQTCSTAK